MKLKIMALVFSVLLLASSLVGCTQTGGADSDSTVSSSPSATGSARELSSSDTDTSWSESDTKITLNGSSISVSGTGAAVNGSVVTITAAGTYVVSGELNNGQIAIAASNTDKVHLVLNGADLTSKTSAPIYASQCDKLIVTLAEGAKNSLTDGGSNFQYADTEEEEPNAALFCKDDLTINGTGLLTVNAGFKNGIGSKDDLLMVSGDIAIKAANHGLRGNDSVTVIDGSLNITAGNDGIQTNNTEDASLGWIFIENGKIKITSAQDGIQADTSITISGGDFTISSGDDGIHADGNLTVNAGKIKVTEAYEGLEAANITVAGGEIDLKTSDDALNAAGGADQSGGGGRFGQDSFAAGDAYSITISGGSVNLMAGGDGLDSNGVINISGGKVVALINSTADNGAIDAERGVTFTGGDIIYGGTGVGSAPSGSSTQSYVFVGSGVTAGKQIVVKQDGQTLITFTPTTALQSLALSSPDIKSGASYQVYSGGSLISTVAAGTGGIGMMGGGPGGGGSGAGGTGAPRGRR